MYVFGLQAGGYENLGCTGKDVENYVRDSMEEMRGRDPKVLYEHFKDQLEMDEALFLTFDESDDWKF